MKKLSYFFTAEKLILGSEMFYNAYSFKLCLGINNKYYPIG